MDSQFAIKKEGFHMSKSLPVDPYQSFPWGVFKSDEIGSEYTYRMGSPQTSFTSPQTSSISKHIEASKCKIALTSELCDEIGNAT